MNAYSKQAHIKEAVISVSKSARALQVLSVQS